MTVRVPVQPEMLAWAVDRARLAPEDLSARFPKLDAWSIGKPYPTYRQLQQFAKAVHVPLGYLFLPEPPEEQVPIPDFRTVRNVKLRRPSPDLLETIYHCQARQDWFRQYAVQEEFDPLSFVGSTDESVEPSIVAGEIREAIGFTVDDRRKYSNWEEARRNLLDLLEGIGVLVMVSGIVGGNTRRALDPNEFRGFALADPLAPVIFVNGADTKAAQIFTLVHELAHLWAGHTGLSDAQISGRDGQPRESWANRVAAEVLLPMRDFREAQRGDTSTAELERLAKRYKVSTLVVLGRFYDAGFVAWDDFEDLFAAELARVKAAAAAKAPDSGGNWHYTQPLRISRQFARAVIIDALEGRTLFRDAYSLLGAARHETFDQMAQNLGVA